MYRDWKRRRGVLRQQYDQVQAPPLFSQAAREVINDRLGYEEIPEPSGTSYAGDGVATDPPSFDVPTDVEQDERDELDS